MIFVRTKKILFKQIKPCIGILIIRAKKYRVHEYQFNIFKGSKHFKYIIRLKNAVSPLWAHWFLTCQLAKIMDRF
jgi:hypothetical protein